jgi:cytochrome c oxidase cbb3-type subunit 2
VPRAKENVTGWQGASLVAIAYVYFLIFAQFAFLARLATLGVAGSHLKTAMAAMAAGGILFSLLMPRLIVWESPDLRLRIGLMASAAAAFLSLLPLDLAGAMAVSLLIGAGLGILTVTLVTHLRRWMGNRNPLLLVGVGTGVGYLTCNLPPLFNASAEVQAVTAGLLCLVGAGITLLPAFEAVETAEQQAQPAFPFLHVLACFAALVWLDSAAFFIIQHTPALKAGTWSGPVHLGANGLLHFTAALAGAWFLRRRGLQVVLSAAFFGLGGACLLLLHPDRAVLASLLYPVGVSLYSVALVAYPSLLAPAASAAERGRRAGWIYAVAGWAGSAMGIGMGQNLGYVPPVFVAAAGAVVLLPWLVRFSLRRKREVGLTAAVMLAALYLDRVHPGVNAANQPSQIERGRQVYMSEGCIHCHSQFVRPNSADVQMWGPAQSMQRVRMERPPLIGNRRQGPDLSEVGGRRSPLWLKAHFCSPPEVSGGSIMPSFALLFRDRRGDDLVAYLESLHGPGTEQHIADERLWKPSAASVALANPALGERIFRRDCATCHAADGHTRLAWQARFKRLPPDLTAGPFFYLPPSGPPDKRLNRLEQIVKFGIPGTDMPGRETMSDNQVVSLSLWLTEIKAQPLENR